MGKVLEKNLLFKEIDFSGSDKIVILNKPKLLEIIEDAYKEDTLTSLREKLFKLKKQLSDFKADTEGLLNIGTNGDTVKINQRYLFSELKQIIESQTLERSKYYLHRLTKGISEYKTRSHPKTLRRRITIQPS